MRINLKFITSLAFLLSCINTFSQDTLPFNSYLKNNFIFTSGYWVYKDSLSNDIDSITLDYSIHGYLYPNPAYPVHQEFYNMFYHSQTSNYNYNEYIIRDYWKRNGGGQYGELGQPIMNSYPVIGSGFNGYQILGIFDSLMVNNITYYNVIWSHVYKNQQYQQEFDYDTDLFFVEHIGIIRKEYIDSLSVKHVWNLISWENSNNSSIPDLSYINNEHMIFPNPTEEYINVLNNDSFIIEIFNITGLKVLTSDKKSIDVSCLESGLYIVIIKNNKGRLIGKEKFTKE